jgi:uncharacterized protein (DUF1330 family)
MAQLVIHDRAGFAQYEARFMEVFSAYQGAIRVVDEAVTVLEGTWPCERTVLLEFPCADTARAWYFSAAYQQLAAQRQTASVGNMILTEGFSAPA